MAKDPAFLFYPGDFNTGTQFFTDDQVGKYMRLLMAQHQHGHLTEDQVIFICKSYDNHIMSKFVKDSKGLWYNERLETEVIKRKNYTESRSKNKEGKTKSKIISKSYDPHMENKNINEDHLLNNKEPEIEKTKLDWFEEIFNDEIFIADLSHTHKGKDLKQAFEECYTHHSNAPNQPRELWAWRQKLNTWLTIKQNGKQGITDKSANHVNSLMEGFKQRHSKPSQNGQT